MKHLFGFLFSYSIIISFAQTTFSERYLHHIYKNYYWEVTIKARGIGNMFCTHWAYDYYRNPVALIPDTNVVITMKLWNRKTKGYEKLPIDTTLYGYSKQNTNMDSMIVKGEHLKKRCVTQISGNNSGNLLPLKLESKMLHYHATNGLYTGSKWFWVKHKWRNKIFQITHNGMNRLYMLPPDINREERERIHSKISVFVY
ncbi:MAG: hypothetical protein ACKVTZ_20660 [Bacteroidia bacterium]